MVDFKPDETQPEPDTGATGNEAVKLSQLKIFASSLSGGGSSEEFVSGDPWVDGGITPFIQLSTNTGTSIDFSEEDYEGLYIISNGVMHLWVAVTSADKGMFVADAVYKASVANIKVGYLADINGYAISSFVANHPNVNYGCYIPASFFVQGPSVSHIISNYSTTNAYLKGLATETYSWSFGCEFYTLKTSASGSITFAFYAAIPLQKKS